MVDLSVKVGSVTLAEPDHAGVRHVLHRVRAGDRSQSPRRAGDQDGVAALPRRAIRRRACHEIEAGMINSIGLPTKGLEYFLEVQLPEYQRFTAAARRAASPSETIDDFAAMARDVSVPGVDAIELNISCPTRQPGGGNFALNEDTTYQVVKALPRGDRQAAVGQAIAQRRRDHRGRRGGREGGRGRDHRVEHDPRPQDQRRDASARASATATAGISGPGVKPIILRMVHQCSKCVKIPIIGCGGIMKVEDVVEYLLAGATRGRSRLPNFRNPTGDDRPHRGAREMVREARVSSASPISPARCSTIRRGTPMKRAWSASAEPARASSALHESCCVRVSRSQ